MNACEIACSVCGLIVKKTRANQKTCLSSECVKAHKKCLRVLKNIEYKNDGKFDIWLKDKCDCGNIKPKKSKKCSVCRSRKTLLENIYKNQQALYSRLVYTKQKSCSICGSIFLEKHRKTSKIYCSKRCAEKAKNAKRMLSQKRRDYQREYMRTREHILMTTDPVFRMKKNVRTRIGEALRSCGHIKQYRTFEMLGYTPEQLFNHISSTMVFGMTWENYGKVWHVDHIKPVSMFKIKGSADIKKAWSLKNMRARFATTKQAKDNGWHEEGNIEKGNRYVG